MHKILVPLLLIATLVSCKRDVRVALDEKDSSSKEKQLIFELNQKKMRQEQVRINAFIERMGWDMTETSTGVRYMVYQNGFGVTPKSSDVVVVDYDIKLLDGTECYSSKETGPENFKVDYDNVESGLHEVMKYLKAGDKAKVILPSHRAFGLIGDNDKIPMNATIVYDIHLIRVIRNS